MLVLIVKENVHGYYLYNRLGVIQKCIVYKFVKHTKYLVPNIRISYGRVILNLL